MRYLLGVLWSLIIFACQQPAPAPAPDPGPSPAERAASVEAGLSDALSLWQAARYPEAQAAVEATYEAHFEPLEPALSASDPESALALEYAFGRLSWQLRRGGKESEVIASVSSLSASVTEAAARLRGPPEPPP